MAEIERVLTRGDTSVPYDSRSAQPNAANVPSGFGHPFSLIPRTPIITAEFLSDIMQVSRFLRFAFILRKQT